MIIGDRIRQRRLEIDMTQDELAKSAGYASRASINKIEKDGRGLPQNKIKAIATALKTTPAFLLDWKEDTPAADSALTPDERRLRALFGALNAAGRRRAIESLEEMAELPKYTEKSDTAIRRLSA